MKIEDMDSHHAASKSVTSKDIQEEYRRVKNMLMQHKQKSQPLRNPNFQSSCKVSKGMKRIEKLKLYQLSSQVKKTANED